MTAFSEGDIPFSEGHFRILGHLSTVSADLVAVPCSSVCAWGRAFDMLWSTASTRCPVFEVLSFKIN